MQDQAPWHCTNLLKGKAVHPTKIKYISLYYLPLISSSSLFPTNRKYIYAYCIVYFFTFMTMSFPSRKQRTGAPVLSLGCSLNATHKSKNIFRTKTSRNRWILTRCIGLHDSFDYNHDHLVKEIYLASVLVAKRSQLVPVFPPLVVGTSELISESHFLYL